MAKKKRKATEPQPSMQIATVLGLFGVWGTGHFYLGQTKRAVLWLVLPMALVISWGLALSPLGRVLGYGVVFGVWTFGILATWLASLIDLRRIPKTRLRRTDSFKVLGFWVTGVFFTVVVRFLLRGFVIEAFKSPAGSMEPTLLVGDHIMADKVVFASRKPKRGEVIIFRYPEHRDQDFVKRVIAVPGDTLEVKSGHPWLNGWEVPHCLVGKGTLPSSDSEGEFHLEFLDGEAYLTFFDPRAMFAEMQGPFIVKSGEVWVMGDNRNNSHDSRMWFGGQGGGVPYDDVIARALFCWLSTNNEGIDWSRYGAALNEPLLPLTARALDDGFAKCLSQRPPPAQTVPPSR
jgi:signal peptidase I